MSWPLSQDYNEAIQSPATNFADADLKKGQATTNALGLPMPFSGNFADVYQVRCPNGSRWAVKCFTRETPGLRERYQEISAWLSKAKLPFSVEFSYLEQGIRVRGKWYPILKMQWVEGLTLNQFVSQYLDKPAMLEALLQLWAKMGKYLRAAKIGHCDLQHGNVLLVPGSTPNALALKLIDYDGMWVPSLAKTKSGEVGHANYQHPRRLREGTYSLEVDRFPLLLVATAMRALKADKGLWAKYDNGDNLLFKESDLAAPGQSPLFEDLASLPDAGLVMLAAQVRAALKGPLESTVLLENAMPEVKAPIASTRPSKLVMASVPGAGLAKSNPRPASAVAVSPAKDALAFDSVGAGATASFIRKRDLAKVKPEGGISAIPLAAWIGGAALVVVAGLITGVALWAMTRKAPPSTPQVVQKIVTPPVPSEPKDPPVQPGPVDTPPVDNPPVVTPPVVVVKPVEAPAGKPKVSLLRTYDWRYAGGVRCISFSRDGNTALALGADGVLTQFNPHTGASMHSASALGYALNCAVLTPDGRRAVIAGGDNKVHVLDLTEGKDLDSLSGSTGPINWVDVAPDGSLAILAGGDGLITLWDLTQGGAKSRWKGSEKSISLVRFSPDGKLAVSCGQDETAHFWDVASGRETFKIDNYTPNHPAKPVAVAFLSDDKVFVGYTANANAVWDTKAGRFLRGGAGGGSEVNRAVAASADGRLTALASDLRSGFVLFEQGKPAIFITQMPVVASECLTFAPDGRHLLVGCVDGSLRYFSTLPGEEAGAVVKAPDQPSATSSFDSGWNKVNPDGDGKFVVEKNSLTIEVPGKNHNLTVENGVMNAPRLVRDVTGDFTVQVRVTGDFDPAGPSTARGYLPVTAAGFLLMSDVRTYFRLERAALFAPNTKKVSSFLIAEWRINGKLTPLNGRTLPIAAGQPMYLRLRRQGAQLTASMSQDGQKWSDLPSLDVALPPTVKLALSAVTTSAAPFKPHFDDFTLTTSDNTPVAMKPAPEKPKLKPPTGDDLAKAIAAVKDEYKADYTNLNTPQSKIDLANKLSTAAFTSKDKPDRQYALLVEARDLAARGEDFSASERFIKETAATFAIDSNEAKEAALFAVEPKFSNKAAAKAYLAEATPLLQEARADDDYDRIAPLLPVVRKAATEAHDRAMIRTVASLEDLQKEFLAVKKDLQTLQDNPDDAGANLAVGKFYCFQKQEWEKGDPFLIKSGNPALTATAQKDLDAPTELKGQVALGDDWMKLGANLSLDIRLGARRRAYDWYTKALPNLSDKEEARVKLLVTELTKQFPEVLAAWENLDVSKVEAVGNAYLRVKPNQMLSTKSTVEGPIEIVLVARTAKAPPSFEFLASKTPFLLWLVNTSGVTGRRVGKFKVGMGRFGGTNFQFTPNEWVTYTCKLQDMRLDGLVNGRNYFVDSNKNDLSKPRTFQVKAINQTLEIQSFTVNPIDKP